jgi:cob(I)alamin adenosyltransferase
MKIYTRTGDEGGTGLYDGTRVSKGAAVVEALGALDELSCDLGCAVAFAPDDADIESWVATLGEHQTYLLDMGSLLAYPRAADRRGLTIDVEGARVARLEEDIDYMTERLPKLTNFILPGGTRAAAHIHKARASCRRAERRIVQLRASGEPQDEPSITTCLVFLNRFSDYLFTLARYVNAASGAEDVVYKQPRTAKK